MAYHRVGDTIYDDAEYAEYQNKSAAFWLLIILCAASSYGGMMASESLGLNETLAMLGAPVITLVAAFLFRWFRQAVVEVVCLAGIGLLIIYLNR